MATYFEGVEGQLIGKVVGVDQTESINNFSRERAGLFPGLDLYFLVCTVGRGWLDQVTKKDQLQ